MLSRTKLPLFLVFALAAVFIAGITHLFVLRFQSGTIYPPYSTLRADPLGAKAFYDSLDALPGSEIERHFRAVKRLPKDEPFTFFYAGVPIDAQWETSELNEFEQFAWSGMRLVLTFSPISEKPGEPAKNTDKKDEDEPVKILGRDEFAKRWGLQFASLDLSKKSVATLSASRLVGSGEPALAWRTVAAFDKLDPDWRVIYQCEGKPVVIERAFGSGTIVLCADSYFLSNEALGKHRAPAFLAWLAGGNRRVIFDELHHGISDRAGVMTLARRHGMFPFFGALLGLAALFVWKNAVPLVPPRDDSETDAVLAGKDSSAGFVNLLRRNIEPRELPGECWRAWRQSFIHQKRILPADLARAESLATAPARDVLATLRELATLLHQRTK